jgi:hypothetical protein
MEPCRIGHHRSLRNTRTAIHSIRGLQAEEQELLRALASGNRYAHARAPVREKERLHAIADDAFAWCRYGGAGANGTQDDSSFNVESPPLLRACISVVVSPAYCA